MSNSVGRPHTAKRRMVGGAGPIVATPRTLAAICGALAGVGGLVHGVGEVRQGRRATPGLVVESWTDGRIADNLGGEPAMTLAPDLLTAGIVTLVVSTGVVLWSVLFAGHRHGPAVLALVSVGMLLAGGGFGPPALGLLSALVAGAGKTRPRVDAAHPGPAWTALFWLSVLNATFLVLGSFVVAVVLDLRVPDLFVASLFLAIVAMPASALIWRVGVRRAHHARPT